MWKITIIAAICTLLWGCVGVSKSKSYSGTGSKKNSTNESEIRNQNITNFSFIFSKIEINVVGNGEKKKLMGSLKYLYPGRFQLSIRNTAGIEGARIYIDSDTILANDRINRKTYYGSSKEMYEKYGISSYFIPVLLGDFIVYEDRSVSELNCMNGSTEIKINTGIGQIKYITDCSRDKIVSVLISENEEKPKIKAEFSNFRKLNDHVYPSSIEIEDVNNSDKVKIEIKRAEIYRGRELRFIPGNNYELILLQ